MVRISKQISESLSEYLILTDKVLTFSERVSLETELGNIPFQYPYVTARMQSVVGVKMALTAGRNGILTMIPRSLAPEYKHQIIEANNNARLKKGDVELVSNPKYVHPQHKIENVVKLVESTGYSIIPVWDEFRILKGIYIHNPERPLNVPPNTQIKEFMSKIATSKTKKGVPFLLRPNERELSYEEIKNYFKKYRRRFVPILDSEGRLLQMAFLSKFDTNFLGIAITTRENWRKEIDEYGPLVDTLCIDSSNAFFYEAFKILKYAKRKFPEKPFGIGNLITKKAFIEFARSDADYIIGGMGAGSICQTGSERGSGRGQFTVARELAEARDDFYKKEKRYVYFVLDGGIRNKKDILVALAFADLIMMGYYFNQFYEAAGRKLNGRKELTNNESEISFVETWGEGHPKTRELSLQDTNRRNKDNPHLLHQERYGHSTLSGSTIEGVYGDVPYRGRLKPCVEEDARYIRTTISNAGAIDLKTFRERAHLEKASQQTLEDMLPHDIIIKEK